MDTVHELFGWPTNSSGIIDCGGPGCPPRTWEYTISASAKITVSFKDDFIGVFLELTDWDIEFDQHSNLGLGQLTRFSVSVNSPRHSGLRPHDQLV